MPDTPTVMVSSNFKELQKERNAVRDVVQGQRMLPLMMETDSAIPDRGILLNSLKMVDEADIYVVLISNYRYGQIIDDSVLNPKGLSVTELEFEHAESRGIPICVYLQDETVLPGVPVADTMKEAPWFDRLQAFRKRARDPKRICAAFKSVEHLKERVTKTLAEERLRLAARHAAPHSLPAATANDASGLPRPPHFYAKPPYTPGHDFEGRTGELASLDGWAKSNDPILVVEAIGGMGKSMLTWQWVNVWAPVLQVRLAGRLWYSFYERGADMRDFKLTALSYMTRTSREILIQRPDAHLTDDLLSQLRQQPWLLVLDGLERILAAYHRSDAAQVLDEEIDRDAGFISRQPRDAIRLEDERLLRGLATANPSRTLITSRLMPLALLNISGDPVPGVAHIRLRGLARADAEAMLRRVGITGDGERMRRYLAESFEGHPLVVGFVAGLIRKALWSGMNFDRWVDNARGGASLDLTSPDIKQRRTNILKLAFDGLEQKQRDLMARMAMLANAVQLDVLEALNPMRPPPPEEGSEDISEEDTRRGRGGIIHAGALDSWLRSSAVQEADLWLHGALLDLEARGLVMADHHERSFDLHPVVRGYALTYLDQASRGDVGQRIADYYSSRPPANYEDATSIKDFADGLQIVRALNLAGKTREAWDSLNDLIAALFRLELDHEIISLMRPWFSSGWHSLPVGIGDDAAGTSMMVGYLLSRLGRHEEAGLQAVVAIEAAASTGNAEDMAIHLGVWSAVLLRQNRLALAEKASGWAIEAGQILGYIKVAQVFRAEILAAIGQLDEARASLGEQGTGSKDNFEVACVLSIELWLLLQNGELTIGRLDSGIEQLRSAGQRTFERRLWQIAGEWHLSLGDHAAAVEAFSNAIEMARVIGQRDPQSEALRGVSLALLGRTTEADQIATALVAEGDPPHIALSRLFLALNQHDKARTHARTGYVWAWADGPPYCHKWKLDACRSILREINEPEPLLPSL